MHDIIVRGFGFFLIAGEKPWDIGEVCSGNCSVAISHLPRIAFGEAANGKCGLVSLVSAL